MAAQSLIHCSALKGSLNGPTLVGKITIGLANRGKKNEDVVTETNDGCFTNGATHDVIDASSEFSDEMQRFFVLCISHCANNAGQKVKSVTLDYFWSLLIKVFATSDIAKVRGGN